MKVEGSMGHLLTLLLLHIFICDLNQKSSQIMIEGNTLKLAHC